MSSPNPHKGRTGLDRILHAARYSANGLISATRNEAAFRQEVIAALVLIPLGLWLGHSAIERLMLVASVLLVMIVELLNSAIEATIDRISLDHHELSGRAKDYGSAAVLLALLICASCWACILYNRFLS